MKIKKIIVVWIVIILLMGGMTRILSADAEAGNEDAGTGFAYKSILTAHDPISIDGNLDFATQAGNGGWDGDGTAGNPYIIENYDIDAGQAVGDWPQAGIKIKNTDVHFVIRNCVVRDGESDDNYGIYFYDGTNGRIENCDIYNNRFGIYLHCASGNTITSNYIYNNSEYGVYLSSSSNNNITLSQIYNNSYGIYNELYSTNNEIHCCNIYNNTDYGVRTYYQAIEYQVNATYNWWGSETGPYHLTTNPGGTGDNVSGNVLYDPWFTVPLSGENLPPVAKFTYSPTNPRPNELIQFTDISSDIDGYIVAHYWTFGDDNTSTEQNPTHHYAEEGEYIVTLTVTDNDTATANYSSTICINWFRPHDPIYIDGNADFASQAASEEWAGNGAEGNPYIIENYDINASQAVDWPYAGIKIDNINIYFIIKDCIVRDGEGNSGIRFFNVTNSKIENITSYNNSCGIKFESSSNNQISTCTIYNNTSNGLYLYSSSSNNNIVANQFYNNSNDGIYLSSSSNNVIILNQIYNNSDDGVYLYESSNNPIIANQIHNNSDHGIYLYDSSSIQIHYNNIHNNTNYGVRSSGYEGYIANATTNWWGNASGPYHSTTNPNGTGDNVSDKVIYESWLTEPWASTNTTQPTVSINISEPTYYDGNIHWVSNATYFELTAYDVTGIYYRFYQYTPQLYSQGSYIPEPCTGAGINGNYMLYTESFTFDKDGAFEIEYYAEGSTGLISQFYRSAYVGDNHPPISSLYKNDTAKVKNKWALICVSANDAVYDENYDWLPAQGLQAYYTLKNHGYADDHIIFMLWHDANTTDNDTWISIYDINYNDLLGPDHVEGTADDPVIDFDHNTPITKSLLRQQIEWLAANVEQDDEVLIYLVNHGINLSGTPYFCFEYSDSESEWASAYEMQTWLECVRINCSRITLLVAACYSGDFIAVFTESNYTCVSEAGSQTGWGWGEANWGGGDNFAGLWFSHNFWEAINGGSSIRQAYEFARKHYFPDFGNWPLSSPLSAIQDPWLIDNVGDAENYTFLSPEYIASHTALKISVADKSGWDTSIAGSCYIHLDMGTVGVDYLAYRVWYDGVWTEWYYINGSSLDETVDVFTCEEPGTYYIEWYAVDLLGNVEPVHNCTVIIEPRVPILIDGNDDFTSQASNESWEGNGTEGNPYIIENYYINASSADGIKIEDTNVYFIIRNCVIHDGKSNNKQGISFYRVANGKIDNVTSYNNSFGIYLEGTPIGVSSNNTITNCNVYNNYYGIYLSSSSNNTITNCYVYNNGYSYYSGFGIYLSSYSNYNQITNCSIYNNSNNGTGLSGSYNNFITNCTVYNNGYGINLHFSSYNNITNCAVYNNSYGINVYVRDGVCHYNQITNCTIYNNYYGIRLYYSSSNNLIYNNYFNNTNNAYSEGGSGNRWNITKTLGTNIVNGPYLGGNYWSDYTCIDANGDGLGDTPYTIPDGSGEQDYLPLVKAPCAVDHIQIRTMPNGGGSVVTSKSYSLAETDTFYAASYNRTVGYIGDVLANWTCSNPSVGVISPGPGTSTTFTAISYGTCVVTASYAGKSNSTGTLTVPHPGMDMKPQMSNVSALPNPQEAGSHVNITCTVTDDVAVNVVKVNITYPNGTTKNITMMNVGTNSYSYNTSYSVLGNYSYYIWANDTSNNQNKSGTYQFSIIAPVPVVVNITYIGTGTINITSAVLPQLPPENLQSIGIQVNVTISGELTYANITIKYSDSDVAGIDETKLKMYYWTGAEWKVCDNTGVDTVNNIVWANVTHLTIFALMAEKVDETKPVISNVQANPPTQTQGGYVNITCIVTDNIGVSTVKVSVTGPTGFAPVNITMTKIAGTNNYYYNSPYTITGTYSYYIWANDTSNNQNISAVSMFEICTSNSAPVAVVLNNPTDITINSMLLSWSQNNNSDFSNYTIYQSTSSGDVGTPVHTITSQSNVSYTVTGLSSSTTYYFTIRVYDTGDLHNDSNQVSGTTPAQVTTGNLTGTVTDKNGKPIEDVTVTIVATSHVTWTDSNGKYTFTGVSASAYGVEVEKKGYKTKTETGVVINTGETTALNIVLEKEKKPEKGFIPGFEVIGVIIALGVIMLLRRRLV